MAKIDLPETNTIGNVLAGLALAFLVDNIALGGAVSKVLPSEIVALVGFVIFIGAAIYGYRAAKRLN
jgi:hypothetical protein